MRPQADTIVVGAGIVGLSTALALADDGVDILCVDEGPPGEQQSFGLGRIFRHAHDQPELVELAARSRSGWHGWEARFGLELLGREGHLLAGESLRDRAQLVQAAALPVEELDSAAVAARFPGLLPGLAVAFFDPGGGSIRARRTIDVLVHVLGSRLARARVDEVQRVSHGFSLATSEGALRCRRLVLCAGGGTNGLARQLGIEMELQRHLTVRVTFPTREGVVLPCLSDRSGLYGEGAYAVPLGTRREYGVGLVDLDLPEADAIRGCTAYVREALPCLRPDPVGIVARPSVDLGTGQDAMEIRHSDGLTVFAGHNAFKFAPLLGRLVADESGAGLALRG
jgi:sarcosine oxidase